MENKFKDYTHEKLAMLAQQGDVQAMEFLIRAYKDVINGKAKAFFIVGADREDVMQEAMIGMFKAIRSYDEEGKATFKTYANLCMNRQLITAIKAANRNKHSPLNTSLSIDKEVGDSSGEGDSTTFGETLEDKMMANPETLAVLNDIARYIASNEEKVFSDFEIEVWNSYAEGMSCEEIANQVGKSVKSIYNARERAKKKIVKYIGD